MHGAGRPVRRGRGGSRHHAGRPAVIEMRAGTGSRSSASDVEPLRRVAAVVMEHDLAHRREQVELVAKRGALGRAGAVIQAEIGAATLQLGDHRHDRRDADAAGQQQVALGIRREREMVARQRDLDRVADPSSSWMRREPSPSFSRSTAMQ